MSTACAAEAAASSRFPLTGAPAAGTSACSRPWWDAAIDAVHGVIHGDHHHAIEPPGVGRTHIPGAHGLHGLLRPACNDLAVGKGGLRERKRDCQ